MSKKINLKGLIKTLKRIPYYLAENDFLGILVFIFFALIIGFLVFYRYNILPKAREIQTSQRSLFLDEKKFQKALKIMESRKQNFNQGSFKEYPNPFKKLTK